MPYKDKETKSKPHWQGQSKLSVALRVPSVHLLTETEKGLSEEWNLQQWLKMIGSSSMELCSHNYQSSFLSRTWNTSDVSADVSWDATFQHLSFDCQKPWTMDII